MALSRHRMALSGDAVRPLAQLPSGQTIFRNAQMAVLPAIQGQDSVTSQERTRNGRIVYGIEARLPNLPLLRGGHTVPLQSPLGALPIVRQLSERDNVGSPPADSRHARRPREPPVRVQPPEDATVPRRDNLLLSLLVLGEMAKISRTARQEFLASLGSPPKETPVAASHNHTTYVE